MQHQNSLLFLVLLTLVYFVAIAYYGLSRPVDYLHVGDTIQDFELYNRLGMPVHLEEELSKQPVLLLFEPLSSNPSQFQSLQTLRNYKPIKDLDFKVYSIVSESIDVLVDIHPDDYFMDFLLFDHDNYVTRLYNPEAKDGRLETPIYFFIGKDKRIYFKDHGILTHDLIKQFE